MKQTVNGADQDLDSEWGPDFLENGIDAANYLDYLERVKDAEGASSLQDCIHDEYPCRDAQESPERSHARDHHDGEAALYKVSRVIISRGAVLT